MVFVGRRKTSINKALIGFALILVLILSICACIVNAVFAATDLQIPVEIIWNDNSDAGGSRPAQVILRVRRTGSNEDLKTVTLTQSDADLNNANRWVTTISGINYNSSYSYQVFQETINDYSITQSANVTATTQLGIVHYASDTISNKQAHYYSDSDFFIIKRHNSQDYYLWSYYDYGLNNLNNLIHNYIDSNITVSSSHYEYGYSGNNVNLGDANLSFDSGSDEITVRVSKGGNYSVYYGLLGNIAQGNTVTLTNTLNIQSYNLTIHHLNEDDTPFAADTVTSYTSGSTYTATPISNNRYNPELTIGQATGTITQDTEVTYVYHPKFHDVIYQFTGSVQPPNASSLLPATVTYDDGDTVTVAPEPTATGYRFLGWKINGVDAGASFTMPSTDVTITGSWEQFNGTFAPTISKTITNPQTVYHFDDTVEFQVYVTNTASFPITNVEVEEQLVGANFIPASGYSIDANDDTKAIISTIPAGATVVLYAEYYVADDVTQLRTNTAEITSATADNYYFLDTTQDYTASVQFSTQSWQDVPVLTGVNTNSTTLYALLMSLGAIGIVGGCCN